MGRREFLSLSPFLFRSSSRIAGESKTRRADLVPSLCPIPPFSGLPGFAYAYITPSASPSFALLRPPDPPNHPLAQPRSSFETTTLPIRTSKVYISSR
jgi:hypothetical protein